LVTGGISLCEPMIEDWNRRSYNLTIKERAERCHGGGGKY